MARRPTNSGRSGRSKGSSRGRGSSSRRGGGGGSNAAMLWVGLGLVIVILGMIVVGLGGNDDKGKDENTIRPGSGSKPQANAANDFNDVKSSAGNEKAAKRARMRELAAKVDMKKWEEVSALYTTARGLRADAEGLRAKGQEEAFIKKIREALAKWRAGDVIYDDWKYTVDSLDDDLIDAEFKEQDRKVAALSLEFRKYIQFEEH